MTIIDNGTLARATALGAATGSRSSAGITALALTSRPGDRGVIASRAGTRPGHVLTPLIAAGELTADKLPSTPSRLGARGIIPRIALAAVAAAGMATRDGERPGPAAVVAAATALGSAALGVRLRALAARRLGSDLPGALTEDTLAATLAWLGTRRRPLPVSPPLYRAVERACVEVKVRLMKETAGRPHTLVTSASSRIGRDAAGTSPEAGAREHGDVALEHLLARVARGDRDAFASLYHHGAGVIYGLIRGITGDPARAEKVTEDVLAEIWRTASCFDESRDSALSWIFSITRRHAASQSHAAGGDGRGPRDLAGTVAAVTRRAGPGTPAELTPGGPATLTEVQRHAVLLACYGGYAQDQIADLLGIPATAVSAQIRDGLLRFGEPTG